jgi:mannose-6-phosphate isomerase-like protein (cupin superfamily)
MKPIIRKPAQGRTIAVVGDVYRFLATGEDTNSQYALWEAIVLPGGGPPPHVHSQEEEGFYILEGEITFTMGDQRLVAGPGMFANMPVGTPRSFKNESGQPARRLISVAPAWPSASAFRHERVRSCRRYVRQRQVRNDDDHSTTMEGSDLLGGGVRRRPWWRFRLW